MRISDWSTEVCSSDLHYVGRLLLEVGERVFARRRLDDRPALVFERQLHGRADAFVVFHGEDARSHDRKPMGCRPPLQGSGLSGWTLPARALAVGGEERVPPGTLAGAVVAAPGPVPADLPTAKIGRASGRERVCQYLSISGVAV